MSLKYESKPITRKALGAVMLKKHGPNKTKIAKLN